MRTHIPCFLLLIGSAPTTAQFYPEANARWCGVDDDGGPPGYDVQLQMGLDPDTTINGMVYKKIDEYRDYDFSRSYYVRSDPNGKGYAYLLDSAAEYITGDLNAQTGDTVHDVLWSHTVFQTVVDYFLMDMVIDTVVTLTDNNVTVIRQLFGSLATGPAFWQAGMGTSDGPMLEFSGLMWTCMIGDTAFYLEGNAPPGPIGIDLCPFQGLGDGIEDRKEYLKLQPTPNPSTGLFHLGAAVQEVQVYNAQGKLLFRQKGNEVDLGAEPPGVYTAVVETDKGRSVERLVVVR